MKRKCKEDDPFFWFKVAPKEILSDVLLSAMSGVEFGCSMRLLMYQWVEGTVPDNLTMLARLCRVTLPEMEAAWPMVSQWFPEVAPGKLANHFMYSQREVLKADREQMREAGRASVKKRHDRQPKVNDSVGTLQNSVNDSVGTLQNSVNENLLESESESESESDKEQVQKPLSIPSTAAVKSADVVAIWNEATQGKLPQAKTTPKRQSVIQTLLKEPGWLPDFRAACAFLAETPWYAGENDRRWVATLDYALQAGKATELAEKATQPARQGAASGKGKQHHRSGTDQRYIEQLLARDARVAAASSSTGGEAGVLPIDLLKVG